MKNGKSRWVLAAIVGLGVCYSLFAEPGFKFLSRGDYYPASRTLQFPYAAREVTNVTLKVLKAFDNNLNVYDNTYAAISRMVPVAERRIKLQPLYSVWANRMLPLGELVAGLEPGWYCLKADTGIDVKTGDYWWCYSYRIKDECFFALTDLGVAISSSPSKVDPKAVVLVHSLKDGSPVAGARVSVLTHANQVAGEGVTDAAGVARLTVTPESFETDAFDLEGVMVRTEKDMCYMRLDSAHEERARRSWQLRAAENVRAFLFAERDLCRPGESFDTGLFLRSSVQGGIRAVGEAPVELELWDPGNRRVEVRRVTTDRWGFVAATWAIPAAARIGTWSVKAKLAGRELGNFPVAVRAYVPDRFRVGAEILGGETEAEAPRVRGKAAYYFGEEVRAGRWSIRAWANSAGPLPHWKGWSVGSGQIPRVEAFEAKGNLTNGTFEAAYPTNAFATLCAGTSPFILTAQLSVTPPGARTVTAMNARRFDPTDSYVGLRRGTAAIADRTLFEVTTLGAKPGETAPITNALTVSFVRREWQHHVVRQGEEYRTEWREEKVPMPTLTRTFNLSDANPTSRLEYATKDLPNGCYDLTVTGGVYRTCMTYWHYTGEVSSRSVSPAELYLKADVETAKPGSVVNLSFRSGYAGHGYVVGGERNIAYTHDFEVHPGENTFSVPVPADARAKFTYVGLTVVNRDAPNARRQTGFAAIPVDHSDRFYPVTIEMPGVVRPGATVDVTLSADGPGAVRLMAVDEGVLALSGYESPDPFDYFYNHDFTCPFAMHDLYSRIYPDLRLLANGQIGGGGSLGSAMAAKNVRTRKDSTLKQKETARIVLPLVELPASGKVTVPVTLPDFTGEMRFMAVGVDDARAGSDEKSVIVRDAASLFLNLPRFVTGGDRYEVVAEVFNHDLPESAWSLAVDGKSFAGRLAKGGYTNVTFTVAVPEDAVGTKTVEGVLKIGDETYRDHAFVTARPKNPPVVETLYSFSNEVASATEWVRLDTDVTERFDSPKPALASALKWLGDYPYGCLEQTTAAAFPFLCAEELRTLGLADLATVSNAALKVKAAYGNILQMAKDDGSFSMWPGGRDTWTEGSLFAMHFIFAAERQGLVKPNPRQKMIAWLRRLADGNNPKTRLERAYAVYVLALAGEKGFANAARNLLTQAKPDFATLLASAALLRGGFASEGALAYAAALEARVWETNDLPCSDDWSPTKAYGIVLALAAEIGAESPDRIAPLVAKLLAKLRPDDSAWGTTRDNAWATYGLAKWCTAHTNACSVTRRTLSGIPKTVKPRPVSVVVTRGYPARVKRGDLVEITVEIVSGYDIDRAVLCDLIPGGFELEDAALKTRASEDDGRAKKPGNIGRSEIRDDRWLWFGTLLRHGEEMPPTVLRYRVRATNRGTFSVPALVVEDMYDPDRFGTVPAGATVVVE